MIKKIIFSLIMVLAFSGCGANTALDLPTFSQNEGAETLTVLECLENSGTSSENFGYATYDEMTQASEESKISDEAFEKILSFVEDMNCEK